MWGGAGAVSGSPLCPTWALLFEQVRPAAEDMGPDQLSSVIKALCHPPFIHTICTTLYMCGCILYINKLCCKEYAIPPAPQLTHAGHCKAIQEPGLPPLQPFCQRMAGERLGRGTVPVSELCPGPQLAPQKCSKGLVNWMTLWRSWESVLS